MPLHAQTHCAYNAHIEIMISKCFVRHLLDDCHFLFYLKGWNVTTGSRESPPTFTMKMRRVSCVPVQSIAQWKQEHKSYNLIRPLNFPQGVDLS